MALMTVREVAQVLSVSERTIARAVDSGELVGVRIGRVVRVEPTADMDPVVMAKCMNHDLHVGDPGPAQS